MAKRKKKQKKTKIRASIKFRLRVYAKKASKKVKRTASTGARYLKEAIK